MTFQLGDRIEELTLLRPDGSAIRLSEISGRPLLLIFLRHLA
jgi:hypothetical protein